MIPEAEDRSLTNHCTQSEAEKDDTPPKNADRGKRGVNREAARQTETAMTAEDAGRPETTSLPPHLALAAILETDSPTARGQEPATEPQPRRNRAELARTAAATDPHSKGIRAHDSAATPARIGISPQTTGTDHGTVVEDRETKTETEEGTHVHRKEAEPTAPKAGTNAATDEARTGNGTGKARTNPQAEAHRADFHNPAKVGHGRAETPPRTGTVTNPRTETRQTIPDVVAMMDPDPHGDLIHPIGKHVIVAHNSMTHATVRSTRAEHLKSAPSAIPVFTTEIDVYANPDPGKLHQALV